MVETSSPWWIPHNWLLRHQLFSTDGTWIPIDVLKNETWGFDESKVDFLRQLLALPSSLPLETYIRIYGWKTPIASTQHGWLVSPQELKAAGCEPGESNTQRAWSETNTYHMWAGKCLGQLLIVVIKVRIKLELVQGWWSQCDFLCHETLASWCMNTPILGGVYQGWGTHDGGKCSLPWDKSPTLCTSRPYKAEVFATSFLQHQVEPLWNAMCRVDANSLLIVGLGSRVRKAINFSPHTYSL